MANANFLLIFAALSLGAPVAGLAQGAGVSLPDGVVEACLADTHRRDLAPDCIGAATRQCQETPDGGTTVGSAQCMMAEQALWDQALNAEWKETRQLFADDTTASDSLLAAQRAWIAWRDAECKFEYDRYGGGSMRSVSAADCNMRATARRALEVRAMRGW